MRANDLGGRKSLGRDSETERGLPVGGLNLQLRMTGNNF